MMPPSSDHCCAGATAGTAAATAPTRIPPARNLEPPRISRRSGHHDHVTRAQQDVLLQLLPPHDGPVFEREDRLAIAVAPHHADIVAVGERSEPTRHAERLHDVDVAADGVLARLVDL